MIVKYQKPLVFNNKCGAIFIEWQLESAILWYNQISPVCRIKTIFMNGKYPAISIHGEKIHVHRLIMSWLMKEHIPRNVHVHHKNENKLDARGSNLEIKIAGYHLSSHNKGRKQSLSHKTKRLNASCITRYGHAIYEDPELLSNP